MDWCVKYRPRRISDLCVSHTKVEVVRGWIKDQVSLEDSANQHTSNKCRMLIVSGFSGVGKRTTIQLLCEELQVELIEWSAPIPTLWAEHKYSMVSNTDFCSKLDEFQKFLKRASLFGSIPLAQGENSQEHTSRGRKKALIIEDLPSSHTFEQHAKLLDILKAQLYISRFPIILSLAQVRKTSKNDSQSYFHDRLIHLLEADGAFKVQFPAITLAKTIKVLQNVAKQECIDCTKDQLSVIAGNSSGDVSNALRIFQFSRIGDKGASQQSLKGKKRKRKKKEEAQIDKGGLNSTKVLECFVKDRELELFHVMGKILYNKRTDKKQNFSVHMLEKHVRHQSENSPEDIIRLSHLSSDILLNHLHENFLDFVHEEAIDDAANILDYLSCSELCTSDELPPGKFGINASSLLAVMGYQYAHCNKAPQAFRQMRKPSVFNVSKTFNANSFELFDTAYQRSALIGHKESSITLVLQSLPYIKAIANHTYNSDFRKQLPHNWHNLQHMHEHHSSFERLVRPSNSTTLIVREYSESEDEIEEV